ncbi:MAG: hypothetical protein N2662_09510 [Bacteroidales bacterium]|nr:hypothetical protein [Bacteroidales bacterium]
MKMQIFILLGLFVFIGGCNKDNEIKPMIDKKVLIGKWVNTQLKTDTLFWNDTIILRTDTITSLPKHSYNYELIQDSIRLEYNGEYYILVPKSSFKISINSDKLTITIEGIDRYFPSYKGNQFKKIN